MEQTESRFFVVMVHLHTMKFYNQHFDFWPVDETLTLLASKPWPFNVFIGGKSQFG